MSILRRLRSTACQNIELLRNFRVDFRINDEILVLNKKILKKLNHDQLIELIKQSSILTMRTLPITQWKVKLIRTQSNGFGFGIRGGKVRLILVSFNR